MRYGVILLLGCYIHPDLKVQYLIEERTHALWDAKHGMRSKKELVWPGATFEWKIFILCLLQDFRTVEECNHTIHTISIGHN